MNIAYAATTIAPPPFAGAMGFLRGAADRLLGRSAGAAKPFITLSNGRCGTTWIATSLASLGDVDLDHEVKWRPAYQPQPVHLVLDSASDSLTEKLRQLSRGKPLVGSKFVLDPYLPFLRHELDELLATIDPETKVVHITRSYFDMLKSFEARGAVNRLSDGARAAGVAAEMKDNQLIQSLARETMGAGSTDGMFSNKPASTLAKSLLIYFINDMVCAKVCQHVGPQNALRISYETMADEFPRVAKHIGSQSSQAEIDKILANPMTKKLDALDDNYLPHFKLLKQLAAELDATRDAVLRGDFDIDATWRDENPPLHVPQKIGVLLSTISALDIPTDLGLGRKLQAAFGR